jgi:hypothetical protein
MSIADPTRTTGGEAPRKKRVAQRDVAKRWTPALARGGWTPISDFFLDNFHRLEPSMTHGEAMLVVLLMRHKWDDAPPFPGFKSISRRMGISITAARQLARRLETKGYLIREKQKGATNRFHLQPLFQALEALQAAAGGEAAPLSGAELLGTFMTAWIRLEQTAGDVARRLTAQSDRPQMQRSPMLAISLLAGMGILDSALFEEIDSIRRIRDAVIHGASDFKKSITPALIQRVEDVTRQLEAAGRMSEQERQQRIRALMTGSPVGDGLSDEARHVLMEAAKDGQGTVLMTKTMHGFELQANGMQLVDGNSPRIEAAYREAVKELVNRGLLEDRGGKGEVFAVTHGGWSLADVLSKRS